MARATAATPVAVIGLGALFPDATDVRTFWRNILSGRDSMADVPPTHWLIDDYYDANPATPDRTYARRGAFLPNVPFDPMAFGIPPNAMPSTDTAQLLALIVAKQVLDDAAKGDFAHMDPERISVILGATGAQELMLEMTSRLQRPVWAQALRELGHPEEDVQAACARIEQMYVPFVESTFPGLLGNVIAGRIANRFNLGGTNCVTDAACASSLSALAMALQELELGHSDVVIAGGVDTMNDISMFMCFSKTPALSPTGDCRPFSAEADGTMLGEGLAMLALKRLDEAERDGDRIYAVIRGLGSSSDGRALSVYAPLPEGQAKALRRAYAAAQYGPETVELVEAHGTGTKAGDAAEFTALARVFDESGRKDRQWCALGSVKSQVGHTKGTAGAAGLMKAVLALQHKVLPPTIKVAKPNPALQIEKTPLYLSTAARPWIRDDRHPRRASVSSFGFGGSNFHVTLEEYGGPGTKAARAWSGPSELFLLGAPSAAVLLEAARDAAKSIADDERITERARRSQERFDATQPHRLAVVASGAADLRRKLEQAITKLGQRPEEPFASPTGVYLSHGPRMGSLAFLFPGQGSQYVGMGADLAMAFDDARAAWDRVASIPLTDEARLQEVVFPPPAFEDAKGESQARRLTATEWAQPAIGAASLALLSVLRRIGLEPERVGGHSFGELTALHAAGAFDVATFLRMARRRGELMRDASAQPGAMTAVAAPVKDVESILQAAGVHVGIANDNSPRQVVLSGEVVAIERAEQVLQEKRLAAKRLPVATAFHSQVVAAARDPFLTFLRGESLAAPRLPVLSNVTAAAHASDPDGIRVQLADQIVSRVRFTEMVEAMYASGVRTFVEVGPGNVLTNLVEQILGSRPATFVALDRKGQNGVTSLWNGLGRLAVAGYAFDLKPLWEPFADEPARPPAPPKFAIPINGANYGRPYPARKSAPIHAPARKPTQPEMALAATPAKPVEMPVSDAPGVPPEPKTPQVNGHAGYRNGVAAHPVAPPLPVASNNSLLEAHAAFQRALSEGHLTFLRAMESSFQALCSAVPASEGAGAYVPDSADLVPDSADLVPDSADLLPGSAGVPPALGEPGVPPGVRPGNAELPATTPSRAMSDVHAREPAQHTNGAVPVREDGRRRPSSPRADGPSALPGTPALLPDTPALLIEIVADKTGYPAEMLNPGMSLEGDLGVDSIKRVEILSAMKDRIPNLPAIKPADVATLRTIGEIAAHLSKVLGAPTPAVVAVEKPPVPPPAETKAPTEDLFAALLAVVADKTGYPTEMLQPTMSLEGDLGVDSIKRVEILSALRDRVPDLPQIKPADVAQLRTLGQIADHLRALRQPKTTETIPSVLPLPGRTRADVPKPALSRAAVVEVGAPASNQSIFAGRQTRGVLVVDEATDVAAVLVARLQRAGLAARRSKIATPDADAIIFLRGLAPLDNRESALTVSREAFQAARAVAKHFAESGGVFVTVQDTGGDFGLSGDAGDRAWLAGLPGLTKTAAQEWPEAATRAIDVETAGRSAEAVAEAIAGELLLGGAEAEVGLHADGTRTTLVSVPSVLEKGALSLRPGAVVVVSGGARGVTVATLEALAREVPLRIAILGRTALADEPAFLRGAEGDAAIKRALLAEAKARGTTLSPADLAREAARFGAAREARGGIAALQRAGAEVRYLVADVTNPEAVGAALADVRSSWGPIAGVIHAAGVLADKAIAEKTDDQFDRVFDTKVRGLAALLDATRADPLELLCVFSSVAARAGNPGQSDYALSNETLNRVAAAERRRRGGTCIVRAIDWGPWEGGMVTPQLRAHFESRGVPLIPLAAGAQAFVDELRTGTAGPVEVLIGGTLGGEAQPGASALERRRTVTTKEMPFLESHRVNGKVVLPAVVVLEWFKRTAQELFPQLAVVACEDLRVLKGIVLHRADDTGETVIVRCTGFRPGADTILSFELVGESGMRHYSASIRMAYASRIGRAPAPPQVPDDAPHEAARATRAYSEKLFHGPHFQALKAIGQSSREGITGTLTGGRALGWDEGAYATDPALLDGGLQLALLWAHERLGQRTLPTRIRTLRVFRPGLIDGPVRAVLRADAHDPLHTQSTLAWIDQAGETIALMEGLEMHVIADDDASRRDAA